MSTVVLRSANSFCEEMSAGTIASTSTPIGKTTIVSFQDSLDVSGVSHNSFSPITRNAKKTLTIDKKSIAKSKNPEIVSSIPVKKRKQFSPKTSTNDASKKIKKTNLSKELTLFEEQISEKLDKTSFRESVMTRSMYKQIVDNSDEQPPKLKNSKTQLGKKKSTKHTDGPINLKKMFKNNIENKKLAKVESVESNVSSEATCSGSVNSHPSTKSFTKRKLYSNVSEFTDNENVKVGETSFLEKKKLVNIYDSSKKMLEADCGIQKMSTHNSKKDNSDEKINNDIYSLRRSKNAKNYFGDEIPEKSIIYKTVNKKDTKKYVSDLMKDYINANSKPDNSLTTEENTKNTMEESESENMFLLQDTDNVNIKNKKRTNKPKSIPNNKIKQKENKNPECKSKTYKVSKKQRNENNQKKSGKPNSSSKEKDSKKKTTVVKRNNFKQKISALNRTNGQSKAGINNSAIIGKYKRKTQNSNLIEDNILIHNLQRKRRLKNAVTHNIHGKQNNGNDGFDPSSHKFSSRYGSKANRKIYQSNDYNEPKSNQLCLRDDFVPRHYQMRSQNNRRFDKFNTCNTELLPKYSKYDNAQQNVYTTPEEFESIYHRYYPEIKDDLKKKSSQVALLPAQPSTSRFDFYDFYNNMDTMEEFQNLKSRNKTVYLANELCEEISRNKSSYVKLYTNTKIIINNQDDGFKLPTDIPRRHKPKAIQNKKYVEYNQHCMRDDVSVISEFSSVSRSNYSERFHERALPQSKFSNTSNSVYALSKRTPLHGSDNTISHVGTMSSVNDHRFNITQHSNLNKNSSSSRNKHSAFRSKNNNEYIEFSESRNDLQTNRINLQTVDGISNNRDAFQEIDSFKTPSVLDRNDLPSNEISLKTIDRVSNNRKVFGEIDGFKTSKVDNIKSSELQLNSPILRKFDQFQKQLKNVSDTDSWQSNFSVIPEPSISGIHTGNIATASHDGVKENPSIGKTNSKNLKADDSWITVERAEMPSSPWRFSSPCQ